MKLNVKFILFLFIPVCTSNLSSQSIVVLTGGATSAGLGGISSLLQGNNAIYHNAAGLTAYDKALAFDISYENKYGIKSLNTIGIGLLKKSGQSSFALGISQFGISSYKEQDFFISYARPLSAYFSLGTTIHFDQIRIADYGRTEYFSFDLGMQSKINNQLRIAANIYNFLQSFNAASNSPSTIAVGLSYAPSIKAELLLEFQKTQDSPMSPKLAIIYRPVKKIELNLGSDITKGQFGFGMGFHISRYMLRMAYSTHQQLGGSYSISFQGHLSSKQ